MRRDTQLFCSHSGEGAETVVLLHGLFGAGGNLAALGRDLKSAYQVLAVDLRNHGRSFHLPDMDLPSMAADVLRLLNAEDLQRVHVVGHSLGGKVAMQLALDYPQRLGHLVVADIAPVIYPRRHDLILDALKSIDLRALRNREQADRILQKGGVTETAVRQFLLTNLTRDGRGDWRWRMNLQAIDSNYDALSAAPQGENPFSGPTLFIKGGDSDYIALEHENPIRRLFPAAELKTIEGAGHWLHAEKPAAFNRLVEQFLAESMSRRAV